MRIALMVLALGLLVTPLFSQSAPVPMSVDDVVTLYKAGISETVLVTRINQSNKPAQLSTDDLLKLANAKVPDGVIQALMNPASGTSTSPSAPATSATPAAAGKATASPRSATSSSAPAVNGTDVSGPAAATASNANITVRDIFLAKTQVDTKKKELDSKSPQPKAKVGGLAGRLGAAVNNTITGDENRRKAAETVLHLQAHDVLSKERKTVIVAIGGKDVVTTVEQNLSDVKREIILLHLDPSVSDKTNDNGAIHDGLAGGLGGMATNVWVYLPKSATGAADAKPDQMLSSKTPGQKQVWTTIFAADGDLPPAIDNKLK